MNLRDRKIGIVLAPGFDDAQVVNLICELKERGAATYIISIGASVYTALAGMRGSLFSPDLILAQVSPLNIDALIVPGGNSTAMLWTDLRVLILVLEMQRKGKPVGAIGNAVAVFASAGIVANRRVTGDLQIKVAVEESGAKYLDQGVVVDRNMVTAQSEIDIPHFLDALAFLIDSFIATS